MEACGQDDVQSVVEAAKVAVRKVCKCRPLVLKDARHLAVEKFVEASTPRSATVLLTLPRNSYREPGPSGTDEVELLLVCCVVVHIEP